MNVITSFHSRVLFTCKRSSLAMSVIGVCLQSTQGLAASNIPPGPPEYVPSRVLTATQTTSLMQNVNLASTPLSSLNPKTAAAVKADSKAPPTAKQVVQRKSGDTSSVYASDVKSSISDIGQPAPPYPSDPALHELFDFKKTGDASQSWAMMSNSGQAFLALWGLGKSQTTASASWQAPYTVPGSGDQYVYVQFPVPGVAVTGVNEQDAPSTWRSHFRADLLLNGYPAWSTEVMRYNELNGSVEKARHLSTFGYSLGHTDAYQEAGDGSSLNVITLYLGRFAAGKVLDLSMSYQAETIVDKACTSHDDQLFCSRGTVATTPVDSDPAHPVTTILTVPAPVYIPVISQ